MATSNTDASSSSQTNTNDSSTAKKARVGYGPNLVFSTGGSPAVPSSSSSAAIAAAATPSSDTKDTPTDLAASLAASERSSGIAEDTPQVRGPDFNMSTPVHDHNHGDGASTAGGVSLDQLFAGWRYMGLQATNLSLAADEINRMIKWRLSDEPIKMEDGQPEELYDAKGKLITDRTAVKCTIFLGYTSNMISSGVREVIKFLVQHNMVQCIVTSAGGVEEDFIKCLKPFYIDDWKSTKGEVLRRRGINRIGPNIGVPNINYCAFQDWIEPILDQMLAEQKASKGKLIWTPSTMIARLGKEINNDDSVYYWAYKNNIPVFCPALTDGSLGDMIYFHGINNPGFILDIAGDIAKIMDLAMSAKKTGQIILGGGIIKHHICNANLMRNGADYSVYINTGTEYDGSDAGAPPDEAVSWGKIKIEAKPVKVWGDASILFPLLVAHTFAKLPRGVPQVIVPATSPYHRATTPSSAATPQLARASSSSAGPSIDRQVSAVMTALTATVEVLASQTT